MVRATLATNAENLVQGMTQFVHDLEQSKDLLRVSQTDLSAFEIGRDLAVTPGKVVFQNDLIQLIQYAPVTEEVYERPLLVVPPWINKFYILDLVPEKSFVKWAVAQGFTLWNKGFCWEINAIRLHQYSQRMLNMPAILNRQTRIPPPDTNLSGSTNGSSRDWSFGTNADNPRQLQLHLGSSRRIFTIPVPPRAD